MKPQVVLYCLAYCFITAFAVAGAWFRGGTSAPPQHLYLGHFDANEKESPQQRALAVIDRELATSGPMRGSAIRVRWTEIWMNRTVVQNQVTYWADRNILEQSAHPGAGAPDVFDPVTPEGIRMALARNVPSFTAAERFSRAPRP